MCSVFYNYVYFTFIHVVRRLYPRQVRNDFNKDVYIYTYSTFCSILLRFIYKAHIIWLLSNMYTDLLAFCYFVWQFGDEVAVSILIRKSKDYVYGIWVYKALGIWRGYYRVKKSLVSYVKPWTEARNNKYMKYHSKLTYQLSFWNVSRKVDYHAGGKWFIHGPKRRKENQLLSLKPPCWLSLV